MAKEMKLLVLATGASGQIYTRTLLDELLLKKIEVDLLVSEAARSIADYELGTSYLSYYNNASSIKVTHNINNFFHKAASSSTFDYNAVITCPASMGFIARVATGISSNLLERSFDVALKERKKIIVVPREMPLSTLHLENLLKLSQFGVFIVPACPNFYTHPTTLQDVVNTVVGKIFKLIGFESEIIKEWKMERVSLESQQ